MSYLLNYWLSNMAFLSDSFIWHISSSSFYWKFLLLSAIFLIQGDGKSFFTLYNKESLLETDSASGVLNDFLNLERPAASLIGLGMTYECNCFL